MIIDMAREGFQPELSEIVVKEAVEFMIKGPRLGPDIWQDPLRRLAVQQVGGIAGKRTNIGIQYIVTDFTLRDR